MRSRVSSRASSRATSASNRDASTLSHHHGDPSKARLGSWWIVYKHCALLMGFSTALSLLMSLHAVVLRSATWLEVTPGAATPTSAGGASTSTGESTGTSVRLLGYTQLLAVVVPFCLAVSASAFLYDRQSPVRPPARR